MDAYDDVGQHEFQIQTLTEGTMKETADWKEKV